MTKIGLKDMNKNKRIKTLTELNKILTVTISNEITEFVMRGKPSSNEEIGERILLCVKHELGLTEDKWMSAMQLKVTEAKTQALQEKTQVVQEMCDEIDKRIKKELDAHKDWLEKCPWKFDEYVKYAQGAYTVKRFMHDYLADMKLKEQ